MKKTEKTLSIPKSKKIKIFSIAALPKGHSLSELELGEYCRKKGIYTHDIQVWKDEIIQNLSGRKAGHLEDKKQAKKDKDRIKSLEKELRRKDKALAETAALLVLRKKLQAFYGEGGEED